MRFVHDDIFFVCVGNVPILIAFACYAMPMTISKVKHFSLDDGPTHVFFAMGGKKQQLIRKNNSFKFGEIYANSPSSIVIVKYYLEFLFFFSQITNISTQIEVVFFGDKSFGSVPSQNISKFSAESDIIKKNMLRKGYKRAVKEALIEMAKQTKSRHSAKHASANVTNKEAMHAPVPRSLPLAEESEVIPASKFAKNISEKEMDFRRSPRLAKEREEMQAAKKKRNDDKQHKRKTTVGTRRSERIRQKYGV